MPPVSLPDWIAFFARHPDAHLLQSPAWGELKSEFDWSADQVIAGESGAQLLFRSLPIGFTIAYLPKGPLGPNLDDLWPEIDDLCRQRRAIFLKVEPDFWDEGADFAALLPTDFRPSAHFIQPPRTLLVDISPEEDHILARMKQKTRYNIRLAAKKGVRVSPSSDLHSFYEMLQLTGQRDRFGVHTFDYYRRAYELFHPLGACELLMAEYQGQPLGGLMLFAQGRRAWYLYGASNDQHRNRMPTYLLQWEAIRWARSKGCTSYDLYGVPDLDEDTLEAEFTQRSDALWGVYRFKRGFGGQLKRAAGSWDKVYSQPLYALYRWLYARRAVEY